MWQANFLSSKQDTEFDLKLLFSSFQEMYEGHQIPKMYGASPNPIWTETEYLKSKTNPETQDLWTWSLWQPPKAHLEEGESNFKCSKMMYNLVITDINGNFNQAKVILIP